MKNEEKIVELLSEMLHKFDVLTEKVTTVTVAVKSLEDEVKNLDKRLSKVEDEIVKLNLVTSQNSLSLIKLVDYYEERFSRIEKEVFKA